MNSPGVEADLAAVTGQQEVVVVEQQQEEEEEDEEEVVEEAQTAVVSLVEAGSQEVLHQVHFTMEVDGTTQEQQVSVTKMQMFIHNLIKILCPCLKGIFGTFL